MIWNRFARPTEHEKLYGQVEPTAPRLTELAGLDKAGFRAGFSGSPMKRPRRDRFVRNALIAIRNSGEPSLSPVAARLTRDAAPLMADAARWACAHRRRLRQRSVQQKIGSIAQVGSYTSPKIGYNAALTIGSLLLGGDAK